MLLKERRILKFYFTLNLIRTVVIMLVAIIGVEQYFKIRINSLDFMLFVIFSLLSSVFIFNENIIEQIVGAFAMSFMVGFAFSPIGDIESVLQMFLYFLIASLTVIIVILLFVTQYSNDRETFLKYGFLALILYGWLPIIIFLLRLMLIS